jgi:hypothetical protein
MSPVPKTFKRSLPFLKILHNSQPRANKIELMKKFPEFVLDDMVELLYNVLIGSVKIKPTQKESLKRHKRKMYQFADLPTKKDRRDFIYKQKGGFLTAILPIIASLLGGLAT